MKKVISIILIATVVLSVLIFPAAASPDLYKDIPRKDEYLYLNRVKEYHQDRGFEGADYREFCYFSDENNEDAEWALIICQIFPEPWNYPFGALVGDRVVYVPCGPGAAKSSTGLLVYIPKTDTFIDFTNDNMDQIVELCPDFTEVIEENEIGQLLGDINSDDSLDILDATHIQLILVKHRSYEYDNTPVFSSSKMFYLADYDRDGETTIMDATAIQMMSAGLEI